MWLASLQEDGKTADALGEEILRKAILANVPDIEQIEAEYQRGRDALNNTAKERLKIKTETKHEDELPD